MNHVILQLINSLTVASLVQRINKAAINESLTLISTANIRIGFVGS